MNGSQPLHEIPQLNLNDTFMDLYVRIKDVIGVVNAIHIYDIKATGGVLHKRRITGTDYQGDPTALEVLEINIARTGSSNEYGYGIGLTDLANPVQNAEGGNISVRLDYNALQESAAFTGSHGYLTSVDDYDLVAIAATGARGDDAFRVVKVFAKDSLPHNISGSHRFSGDIYFDGSQVVVNSAELHIDDNLLFLASAGNTDDPNAQSGLSDNDTLAGGSGSGFVVKGASGDKVFAYRKSDTVGNYYSFYNTENLELATNKGFVSPNGQFKFVGISGSSPSISLRTAGQDFASSPVGWKIYQSATGAAAGSLKLKREGITDIDALELFANSEVKIGTIYSGTAGDGSFKTQASKFSVPSTRESPVLHHSWQNRDVVEIKATAEGGIFAEPTTSFKAGTVLTFNTLGQYKRAQWDADPATGYKDAEVVGIIEKITSDDYVLQVPVHGNSYTTSLFSVSEPVSIVGNGKTIYGYVYESLPASGLSGIKIFVDSFPSGVTAGWFAAGGSLFLTGATLKGSADEDLIGVCASIGITLNSINYAVIVRQGLFDIPETGVGATGYDSIASLTGGYLFYLEKNGGVTYSNGNLFDPEAFYLAGSNVAKPLFIYLGSIGGKKTGLFQHYQGLGLTYSITSYDLQPVYFNNQTSEITNFDVIGEVSGRNKIVNSGFDYWTRLDAFGSTYEGLDGGFNLGLTFNQTTRAEYPFGTQYSTNDDSGVIKCGYIADSYFVDTYSTNRVVSLNRQKVSSDLPSSLGTNEPNYELKLQQVSTTDTSGKTRVYSIIPDHKTLQDSDMNFSFCAKSSNSLGITVGIAYVWSAGTTYAKINAYHKFISTDGTAVTGGVFDCYNSTLTNNYLRYKFAFTSESVSCPGASDKDSFIAPFIEIGNLGVNDTFHLTGLQLSKGMTPKPYEKRPVSTDKSECDRFFQNVVVANGGYYPLFTGLSGPSIFTAVNLQTPLCDTPQVTKAMDVVLKGIVGASATVDPENVRKNSISLFRETTETATTYHRYFETVYSLDSSGFSGSVSTRLAGMA